MKRIYFDDNSLKNTYPLIIGLFLILIPYLNFFDNIDLYWGKWSKSIGWIIYITYFLKKILNRNYVMTSKQRLSIKINSYFGSGINLKYDNLKEVNLFIDEDILIILLENGTEKRIDLSGINKADINKLFNILLPHTFVRKT